MFTCNISCTGLYADVQHVSEESTEAKHDQISKVIQKSYSNYKNSFAKNIEFYQDLNQVSGYIEFPYENAYLKEYPKLIFVDIFFDTATYDEIKRDKKFYLVHKQHEYKTFQKGSTLQRKTIGQSCK